MKRLSKILFVLSLLFFANSTYAYYSLGQPTGFVNDYTNTLNTEQIQLLENKLSQFERETSNEISIVIIKNLKGDVIENFAEELFKDWGIGKKNIDNGILILIAKEDREMRIEVGYGLEGALTDAQSYFIINKIMKPAFQENNFLKGLSEASDKIILAINGEKIIKQKSNTVQQPRDYRFILWVVVFGFLWLSNILGRSKSWWLGGVLGAFAGIILGLLKGFLYFGIISIAVLIPVGLLFDFIVSKQYRKGKAKGHIPWWIGGARGGRNGRFGGGFGGFGGGMSGGGGSSGRW